MSIQRWLNIPNRAARTRSPGERVLERDASHAPVPLAGKTNAWPEVVLKIFFRSSSTGLASAGKSDDRWSSIARCMARRTRSGTLVGPGTKRKLRPAMENLSLRVGRCQSEEPALEVKEPGCSTGGAAVATHTNNTL